MSTWPISELSGLLDPGVFVIGYTPTGVDVGQEISQVLNHLNTVIGNANELKTDLDAEVVAGEGRDTTLASHAILIQTALNYGSDHENRVGVLETHAAGDGSDHADVAQNTSDIADLQSEVGLGYAQITSDVADFDFGVYGDYNQFILNKDASVQDITLTSPTSTSWPQGRKVTFYCDASYGALVASDYFVLNLQPKEIFLEPGDVLDLTVVQVTVGVRWMATKRTTPLRDRNFLELTATQSYSASRTLPYKHFIVSGQAGGELATVTLPEITDDMVAVELKGFLHGSTGDGLKFLCSGTDQILDLDGGTGDYIIADGSTAKSIITLTALPAVGGVYYWGASLVGATS